MVFSPLSAVLFNCVFSSLIWTLPLKFYVVFFFFFKEKLDICFYYGVNVPIDNAIFLRHWNQQRPVTCYIRYRRKGVTGNVETNSSQIIQYLNGSLSFLFFLILPLPDAKYFILEFSKLLGVYFKNCMGKKRGK